MLGTLVSRSWYPVGSIPIVGSAPGRSDEVTSKESKLPVTESTSTVSMFMPNRIHVIQKSLQSTLAVILAAPLLPLPGLTSMMAALFWLLIQARKTGKDKESIPGSVSKWAVLMNVSRPLLHRELRKLEEAGIIAYVPPMITIIDADALMDVLSQ